MCGIIGVINLDKNPVEKDLVLKMTRKLHHRGPDDEGIFVDKNIGLGHRRLAIIDLSKAGHQPMISADGNLSIVFNGEIYNYLELKQELIKQGYKFKTESDTEVILVSYKAWGEKCLERFNGMWGFIIVDRKKQEVFVSRDRLGVKPVYYYQDKSKILIASEIKAILEHPEIKAKPNKKIIWDYLITGWLDHSEETFFSGIKELRGGHYLKLKNSELRMKEWWDLKIQKVSENEERNIERFQYLFLDAVRLRLRSDVPIGSCLSGGLDSSAIVMVINKYLKQEKMDQARLPDALSRQAIGGQVGQWQKTFSAVYGKEFKECDEQQYIKEVLKKTGAKGYLIIPSGKKLKTEMEKLVYFQDQPFTTTSMYAQWNVFRLAAQKKMKVMLDGQGADELMAGYTGYFGINLLSLLKQKNVFGFLRELYYFGKKHSPFWANIIEIIKRALRAGWLGSKATKRFQKSNPAYEIYSDEFLNFKLPPKRPKVYDDFFRDALYHSIKMNLSSLLRYEDRNSMAFSIESRVPFLDYRLVEFIFSLENSYKIRNGETKWIMREALKGLLPEKIRTRQDKIGFATPEAKWLKEDLASEMKKVFSSDSFASRGFINKEKVLDLFSKFRDNKFSDSQLFFRLYCLEIWYRIFID